jgi:hypothetical protein
MANNHDALKKARKKKAWAEKIRKRDPAWVYLAGGVMCLGIAVLYALYGNHTGRPTVSARGIQGVRTPFDIYAFTIITGVVFVILGVRKLSPPKDGPEQE